MSSTEEGLDAESLFLQRKEEILKKRAREDEELKETERRLRQRTDTSVNHITHHAPSATASGRGTITINHTDASTTTINVNVASSSSRKKRDKRGELTEAAVNKMVRRAMIARMPQNATQQYLNGAAPSRQAGIRGIQRTLLDTPDARFNPKAAWNNNHNVVRNMQIVLQKNCG
jgi:hypothetical protein